MRRALAVAFTCALAAGAAQAGRACDNAPLTTAQMTQGMALAQATAQELDRSGAQVVLLARAGQDLSEHGLQWSHLGFAYRESADGKPVWRVLHKLNHCGTADSALYRQGLGEFFLDRPHRYAASYAVPTLEFQKALLPLLRTNARAANMHHPRYNMVAYPWAQQYQQSNQWVTETLAAAAAPREVTTRAQAQDWLQRAGYQPTTLRLSTAKRLGARIGMANIAFDDHPTAQRFAGRIETTTADSVFAWAARVKLADSPRAVPFPSY